MGWILPDWNISTLGNIFLNKKRPLARVDGVQRLLDRSQSQQHINLDWKLRRELDAVLKQEGMYWYQKSWEEWIKSEDLNTKFYHASTKVRRSRNKSMLSGMKEEIGHQIQLSWGTNWLLTTQTYSRQLRHVISPGLIETGSHTYQTTPYPTFRIPYPSKKLKWPSSVWPLARQ